jgi:hypothetical protein
VIINVSSFVYTWKFNLCFLLPDWITLCKSLCYFDSSLIFVIVPSVFYMYSVCTTLSIIYLPFYALLIDIYWFECAEINSIASFKRRVCILQFKNNSCELLSHLSQIYTTWISCLIWFSWIKFNTTTQILFGIHELIDFLQLIIGSAGWSSFILIWWCKKLFFTRRNLNVWKKFLQKWISFLLAMWRLINENEEGFQQKLNFRVRSS